VAKRALLVGINDYDDPAIGNLKSCVTDATEMGAVLSRHGADDSINFESKIVTSSDQKPVTRAYLRKCWRDLFDSFTGDVLFYFAGHGTPGDVGGYLVTQDGTEDDYGLPMDDIVAMANNSAASTVLLILDCCYSGAAGNTVGGQNELENRAVLREGVTILAASRPTQESLEVGEHGVFSNLVLGALRGGAADVRGRISAAGIYGYVEAALGNWEQRPLYKSHAGRLEPVRICAPRITDALLRELVSHFKRSDEQFMLNPTYEETSPDAIAAHVAVFKKFKNYQVGGLLTPVDGPDLYWAAMRTQSVKLTDLGQFYHSLVSKNRI
jgi:Caspase domain